MKTLLIIIGTLIVPEEGPAAGYVPPTTSEQVAIVTVENPDACRVEADKFDLNEYTDVVIACVDSAAGQVTHLRVKQ